MEGNNSELMKKIMSNQKLMSKFMKYVIASEEKKKDFEFIKFDDGSIQIYTPEEKEQFSKVEKEYTLKNVAIS